MAAIDIIPGRSCGMPCRTDTSHQRAHITQVDIQQMETITGMAGIITNGLGIPSPNGWGLWKLWRIVYYK